MKNMKRFFTVCAAAAMVMAASSVAFAGNNVSQMAVEKGGQHIAECARMMDKGISECARMAECAK